MTKYSSPEDIAVTIQILKHVLSKIADEPINAKIAPQLNRVIMELEEL